MNVRTKFMNAPIRELPVFSIEPSPFQARRNFSQAGLNELALSIRRNGLLQPITVRELEPGRYQLIAGERRLRACRIAGFAQIRAQVLHASDQEAAMLCMVENLQREGLHYFDEAEGILQLMHTHRLTQEQVAQQLGKQQSTIANKLRLLRLSPEVRRVLMANGLTERHARAILRLPDEATRLRLLEKIVDSGLNVRETDLLVERELSREPAAMVSRRPRAVTDWRGADTAIRQTVNALCLAGLSAECRTRDLGDAIEISVTVPKGEAKVSAS